MASFIGTNKEFRRYIGPRLRNLVQQFTKKHKAEISACEHCTIKENLESAHVHGRDRNEIIDLVLSQFTHNDIITVDIEKFEGLFKKEHHPLEKSILILCRKCHREYDTKVPKLNVLNIENNVAAKVNIKKSEATEKYDYLPITLEPSSAKIFKQELLLSKQAIIETIYNNGSVEKKIWKAQKFHESSNLLGNLRSRPEFRTGKWQEKGIVKVHVRILKNA